MTIRESRGKRRTGKTAFERRGEHEEGVLQERREGAMDMARGRTTRQAEKSRRHGRGPVGLFARPGLKRPFWSTCREACAGMEGKKQVLLDVWRGGETIQEGNGRKGKERHWESLFNEKQKRKRKKERGGPNTIYEY